jgi:hypothetical protein
MGQTACNQCINNRTANINKHGVQLGTYDRYSTVNALLQVRHSRPFIFSSEWLAAKQASGTCGARRWSDQNSQILLQAIVIRQANFMIANSAEQTNVF